MKAVGPARMWTTSLQIFNAIIIVQVLFATEQSDFNKIS